MKSLRFVPWGVLQAAATQLSLAAIVRARMLTNRHYSKTKTSMNPDLKTKLPDKGCCL